MPMELKSTINLPKTGFPMKAGLPQNEPKILARWEEQRIYDRIREVRKGASTYVLHDGPPYANGPIHLGTAMNKCLKDFIVKSKNMAGFDSPYVPGWDCHGLPIEIKVDQMLGGKKLQMAAVDVRAECRKYAEKYLDLQRSQFKRIGCFGRWDHPYSTMTPQYEAAVLDILYRFLENDFVYKGLRSVYWCVFDETALAEAEVEYENHTSPTVWVKYAFAGDPASLDAALVDATRRGKKVFTIIWTTTPWTLPASMAVAFHPDEEYVALESGDEVFIVAARLASAVQEKTGLQSVREIARFPGRKLEYAEFRHPFLDRKIVGVLADYVTMDQGTGVVHTAPAHGAEDFVTGQKYKIDPTCNVDKAGIMRNGLPEYEGKRVFDANAPIVELLKARGVLMHSEKMEHSYPHCWRCHNPVIFRATEQWFIGMDTPMKPGARKGETATEEFHGETMRSRTLHEIAKVKWDPAWGEERISNMIATRPDWCISRQRVWGVPIAVFLCDNCGKPVNDPHIKVVQFVSQHGADAWYTPEADAILSSGHKCVHCGGTKFKKETDILDVWFESGSSHAAVLGHEPNLPWPADLYLEGGDQHRGWFHSSLLCAIGYEGSAPYRMVATSGWTLDEQGRAMSKSLGNTVDPVEIADTLGGEIVRMWVASVDFREDVACSPQIMQRVAGIYRDIRNTFRFILSNLDGFDPVKDAVAFDRLQPLDQYMLRQAVEMSADVQRSYEEFAFHKIYHRVNNFCGVELSAFYFDVLKDRLYTSATPQRNSISRRAAQTAIWRIGEALVRLLAPIMSFTCEEVWQYLPAVEGRPESVHLTTFPETSGVLGTNVPPAASDDEWYTLRMVRSKVLMKLEVERANKRIGTGLEAQVVLTADGPCFAALSRYESQLRYLFIVSSVTLQQGQGEGIWPAIDVRKADGLKCERCWNFSTHVGEDGDYPTVCERCSAVLREAVQA